MANLAEDENPRFIDKPYPRCGERWLHPDSGHVVKWLKRLISFWTKKKMQPLSPEEQEKSRPLPPEMLVGALQDPIHRDVGRSRPAKTTRAKGNIAPKQTKDCTIGM